jgi:hypothetical protein
MPAAEKSAKERAEEFHQRQRAWKACRCKDCRAFYDEQDRQRGIWAMSGTWSVQPPIDEMDVNFAIVRATLGSFRDV